MPEGRIVKALSGYYYVQNDAGIFECRARGLFKKKQLSPLVGDWVTFEPTEGGKGYIQHIAPRTTTLVRPPVANVDQAVIVSSFREPDMDTFLIDKFLVHAEHARLTSVIILTKSDLPPPPQLHEIVQTYRAIGYPVITTSVVTAEGIDSLREVLSGRISVFAGPSGVGKSSLMNALLPDQPFRTGAVSRKLGRGRHTTRHVEMVRLPSGGWVVDTPGFSQLSFQGWEAETLSACFPEFLRLADECRFRGCLHFREPGCAIKGGVEQKDVSRERYEHYVQFLQEILKQRRY